MNTYKKRNFRGKRGYSGRPHRRTADSYHQPMPPEQNRIPYARHTLTKPDVEAVVDALLSGNLTQGRELERFESLLSKLTHSEYAIAMSTGTAAIHAALACLKLEPEDEVITSTLNFCSVVNMIRLVGAKPVLVDCDPETLTLSVSETQKAVTENTKAIFTNNFGGHPSELNELRTICDEHNLILIEDASHGLGGKYRGHYVGNQADLTCFSFHPSKAITTCEGGAVTTNNRAIAEWLRLFRHHGIQKVHRYFQSDEEMPAFYQELQFAGMNYRLSEIHAALGRSQLTRLDRHIERRRSIAQVYQQKLGVIDDIKLPYDADWADNAYHLYPVQFVGGLAGKRNEIYQELKNAGIDCQVHYVPVHRMPLYAKEFGGPSAFPNAEAYYASALSLPLYPDLAFKEIERITDLLVKFATDNGSSGNEMLVASDDSMEQDFNRDSFDEAAYDQDESTDDDAPVAKEEEPKPEAASVDNGHPEFPPDIHYPPPPPDMDFGSKPVAKKAESDKPAEVVKQPEPAEKAKAKKPSVAMYHYSDDEEPMPSVAPGVSRATEDESDEPADAVPEVKAEAPVEEAASEPETSVEADAKEAVVDEPATDDAEAKEEAPKPRARRTRKATTSDDEKPVRKTRKRTTRSKDDGAAPKRATRTRRKKTEETPPKEETPSE